eukprot:CAMPEP_0174712340 /NCGR_PEP_ID=MMETSP1094-20130205/13371_1 /TAXON_ID=156173 /ORGANISM="Chrysochromulina brevifilum, Strain UTEX LB 985" /LENGTH=53 /DNA_ID=CAMNT_0015911403 /DNA_START=337 /DNA_END=498 /DNA_ORIENTATION=-
MGIMDKIQHANMDTGTPAWHGYRYRDKSMGMDDNEEHAAECVAATPATWLPLI